MTTATRYVGLDIHKRHVMIAAVDDQQDVILAPQKVSVSHYLGADESVVNGPRRAGSNHQCLDVP